MFTTRPGLALAPVEEAPSVSPRGGRFALPVPAFLRGGANPASSSSSSRPAPHRPSPTATLAAAALDNSADAEAAYDGEFEEAYLDQDFTIKRITGDGRCMFRALARGIAANQGLYLPPDEEAEDADILRLAVADALCRTNARRKQFQEAVTSVELAEGGIPSYCQRLQAPSFWGGEVELLVLSRLLRVPIYVYQSAEEADPEGGEWGFAPIVKYGAAYEGGGAGGGKGGEGEAGGGGGGAVLPGRKPVHLLYTGGNHYDLLMR